jgi:hypothetical protein
VIATIKRVVYDIGFKYQDAGIKGASIKISNSRLT